MNQLYLKRLEGLVIDDVSSSVATFHPLQSEGSSLSHVETQSVGQHVLRIGDYTLTIMNRCKLEGLDSLDQTGGLRITAVNETEDAVTLMLQDSIRIVIDLRDEAYVGPEALVLHGPDDLIVVWN